MNYQWSIPLLAGLANAALGTFVLFRNPRHPLNIAYAFLAGSLVLWNLNIFGFYFFRDAATAFQWARAFRVGTIMLPTAIAVFAYVFAERHERWSRWVVGLSVGLSVFLVVTNAFDLVVAEVRWFGWGYYSIGTRLYNLLVLNFVLSVAYTVGILLREVNSSGSPRKRDQARLWLLAAAVAVPLGLTNLLPAYGLHVFPLGNLANVAYVGIVAYAIVRHRLMDIDIVITKGMAYAATALAVIAPTFGLLLVMQRASFGQIHPDFSFALLALLIGVGVLFPTLRRRAESGIERSFFRQKHEYRVALTAFTRSIVRILDRDKLLHELAETLTVTLQLDRLAVCLFDEGEHAYTVRHTSGIAPATGEFGDEDELVVMLRRREDVVMRDELEATADSIDRIAAETCARNGWEVCIPLTASDRLIGFIALGRKRNLEAFYAEDLQLLSTLAAEASIALENARLYEELKKSRDIIERTGRLSALGTLAAGIAHEIRNPLVSIQTFFQLAPQRRHDPEFFTSFLSLTAGEVDRIGDLITELLSFARSPSHRVEDVDINDLIERTTLLLDPEARKSRVKLARLLATDLPVIRADGDQLKQVVINLVLNAIQATPAGGTVTVLTRRHRHQGNPLCQIEVRDTGVGIPPKMIEDIFNPFFTTKDKGTGLGLSIAHQIATEHGGFITVTSEMDHGSSFYVNLPLTSAIDSPTISDEPEAALPLRYGRMAKL
ncbi:MAG: GAF domain-containing protein [Deltaproteobacteria bacterium]|nr:GAF domain-containing protein [Deltaproteobacteria bacterium]MBI3390083.1 GAF domain-containing protein [Deltaproteobacteria bacterium]